MLRINSGDSSFTVERIKAINERHGEFFCLANLIDEYVFVIGGYTQKVSSAEVSRYNIYDFEDRWEAMPKLIVERAYASACSLGGNIYVIGG